MLVIAGIPLTVSSIRNHLFLLQHVFNRALDVLGVAGFLLASPSNRYHLFSLHDALNWPRIMFVVTGVLLTIPSTRNRLSLLLIILSTRPDSHSKFSIPQESYFSFTWTMLFLPIQQAASFSLTIFYHWFLNWKLLFYTFHQNMDKSLNTAL